MRTPVVGATGTRGNGGSTGGGGAGQRQGRGSPSAGAQSHGGRMSGAGHGVREDAGRGGAEPRRIHHCWAEIKSQGGPWTTLATL